MTKLIDMGKRMKNKHEAKRHEQEPATEEGAEMDLSNALDKFSKMGPVWEKMKKVLPFLLLASHD